MSRKPTVEHASLRTACHPIGWVAVLALVSLCAGATAAGQERTQAAGPSATAEASPLSPDLRLYQSEIAAIRRGENYYDAAHRMLPDCGFPTGSVFNWRLPTTAWITASFPANHWARYALIALALLACERVLRWEDDVSDGRRSWILGVWLFGIVSWLWDGEAYLTQEVWAAVILLAAVASRQRGRRHLGAGLELAALFVRELVLPWLVVSLVIAGWRRQWRELTLLIAGLTAWGAFFTWHAGEVARRLTEADVVSGAGASGWLAFGGVSFLASTMRMNGLIHAAPAVVGLGLLALGFVGLLRRTDELGRRLAAIVALYVAAFTIVGQPFNLYWGLMYVPALGWGLAQWTELLPRATTASESLSRNNTASESLPAAC
jgi:hypothetical protein